MKTVVIHGQNHKGSSYHLGEIVAQHIAAPEEITEIFLPRDLNHFCLGCYQCLQAEEKCPFYEEKKVIMDAVKEADVLVFTTPTYCMRASASMKAFIDLTFVNWMPHRPQPSMFNKKAVVISTAAGAGAKSAIKDITTCLSYWGVSYIKTLGASVAATNWNEIAPKTKEKITKKAEKIAAQVCTQKVRVNLKTRFIFQLMKLSGNDSSKMGTVLQTDYLYWKENGWFNGKKPY
ncbi:MAG: NAD(P)H-dependent oxidoreductase [Oscillospiraceae bacterium]|nr:NAD(P)H-dependent oxidoreductase [Oscillospiraceae bacterium]